MAQYIAVKDFETHQHYKERRPPWIKLHYSTLSSYEVTSLPDAAQAQLFKMWLLASRHDNLIPYDMAYIRREIKPSGKLYLRELLASGLLALCERDASATLGLARADARSREGEGEKETTSTSGRDLLLARMTPIRRQAFAARLDQWAHGYDLPAGVGVPTAAQIDRACLDLVASVEDPASVTPKALLAFLTRELRGEGESRAGLRPVSLTDALLRKSEASAS